MTAELAIVLHALATETVDGTGSTVALTNRDVAALRLNCTAVSGSSPTLYVEIETSTDGGTWWPVGNFTLRNAIGQERIAVGLLQGYIRCSWVLGGGSPSFTFSVDGKARITYATVDDFESLGLPAAALSGISDSQKIEKLLAASAIADSYLRRQYGVPLPSWNVDLRMRVCEIAAWLLMCVRGYAPEGTDLILRQRYEDAIMWLQSVAKGLAIPIEQSQDATPLSYETVPLIYSEEGGDW